MTPFPAHARVEAVVQVAVGCLDAHEVTVGASLTKCLKVLVVPLAHAKRQGDIQPFDFLNNMAHARLVKVHVLARLEHDSLEVKCSGALGRLNQFLVGHSIALHLPVAATDAAIQAVVAADVGKLDKPSQVDSIAHGFTAHVIGPPIEFIGRCRGQQLDNG